MPIYQDIQYIGPPRWYGKTSTTKKYIAIHCTANTATAENEAAYARRRDDAVSSHYYVDADSIVQSLDTDLMAFHAGSTQGNTHAIAYEITGLVSWSRQQWLDSVAWPLLARQIRRDMAAHGIAARRLTIKQIQDGELTGVITHDDMRRAWGGTTHTDPGPNFPLDHLLKLIEEDDMPTPSEIAAAVWSAESGRGKNRITFGAMLWEIRSLARAAAEGRMTQEDLDALRAAIRESVLSTMDDLAELIAARLPEQGITCDEVLAALRAAADELTQAGGER